MTDRITKAREAIEATITRYCGVYASHAKRALPVVLDEFHNAVVEATLAAQRLTDSLTPVEAATPKFDEVQAPDPYTKAAEAVMTTSPHNLERVEGSSPALAAPYEPARYEKHDAEAVEPKSSKKAKAPK